MKLRKIKKTLGREANLAVIHDVPKWAHIQALLSRGDRRVGRLIEAVYENGGDWKGAIKAVSLDARFYTTRQRCREELFPWDVIDIGIEKGYLWKEYERGLAGKYTPPCDVQVCRRCGIC